MSCTYNCNQCKRGCYARWEQAAELLLFALAIVGVVALCALAGYLIG